MHACHLGFYKHLLYCFIGNVMCSFSLQCIGYVVCDVIKFISIYIHLMCSVLCLCVSRVAMTSVMGRLARDTQQRFHYLSLPLVLLRLLSLALRLVQPQPVLELLHLAVLSLDLVAEQGILCLGEGLCK